MESESQAHELSPDAPLCTLCGGPAVRGCLYGSDRISFQWRDGDASWKNNLTAAWAGGIPVGRQEFLAGTFASGVRCPTCQKLVLGYGEAKGR